MCHGFIEFSFFRRRLNNMKCKTQLKLEDRIKIENCLANKTPVSVIGKRFGVSKQTIYREIVIIKNKTQ